MSTAAANTVATAVAGATIWAKLTADNLTGTGNSFGAQLLHIQDQKASGTSGGTFNSGSWQTRVLNTTLTNEIGASLASNQITLPTGTYFITASAPASQVDLSKLKLRNISDATDTLIGTSNNHSNGSGANSWIDTVSGRFTIAGPKVFELQHRCSTSVASVGLGRACGFGVVEVYAEVLIWKVA